jgi:hypothetical protein
MRKLRPYLLMLLVLVVPALGACDMFDLDINTDPNAATAVQGDLLLPAVLARVATQRQIEMSPGTAFFSQVWASGGSTGVFTNPDRYIISSFTTGNNWSIFWTDGLKNLMLLRDQALAATPAQPNAAAQAEIKAAYIFWILTSLWGDIPFTQALDGVNFPHPEFDSQETVLRGLLPKLDAAIALIDRSAGALPGVGFGDLMYGGNMDNWERFANSLKLRTLMMIRNRDTSVDAQITALLSQPLIRTNAQQAEVPFFVATANENPIWRLNNMFGGFTDTQRGNYYVRASDTFIDIMRAAGDPRIDTYFEMPVNFSTGAYSGTQHVGARNGVANWPGPHSSVHQNIFRPDWPARIATAAETYFYEAEFLAKTGNLPGAHTAYMTGIQLALNWFDGKPGAISAANKQAYLAGQVASFANLAQALENIHRQQYIEVFDRAPENWVHWKRTHYPTLVLPTNAELGNIIRRYPYPPAELSSNPNAPDQVALDMPMWFEPTH